MQNGSFEKPTISTNQLEGRYISYLRYKFGTCVRQHAHKYFLDW